MRDNFHIMKTQDAAWKIPPGAYTVKSLVKALAILECLAEGEQKSYTLTELSRRLHIHVSTVHRLLVNLLRQGFVEQDPATGGYQLGFHVLRMGLRVLGRLDFRRVAQPMLLELNRKTQETVHLAIFQNDHSVSIEKYDSPQPVGLDARLGGMMPLHCTGVGKALLAFQSEAIIRRLSKSPGFARLTTHTITSVTNLKKELALIRREGYSVDNEEAVEGLRCVAAPLFDHTGKVIAAFSVAGPATRMTLERVPEIARLVCETSRLISYQLGYGPRPAQVE